MILGPEGERSATLILPKIIGFLVGRKNLFKMLNVGIGYHTMHGLVRQENLRLTQASRKIEEKYKTRRQALRQLRINVRTCVKTNHIFLVLSAKSLYQILTLHVIIMMRFLLHLSMIVK